MVARRAWRVLVAVGVVGLVALAWLGTQVRPINDDYCIARGAYNLGLLGYVADVFQNWHGGFVAVFVAGLFALPIGAHLLALPYAVFGPATVLLAGLGVALLVSGDASAAGGRRATAARSAPVTVLALAAPLGLSWLVSLVVYGHVDGYLGYAGLYWMAASVVHIWPVIGFAVLAGLLARSGPAPGPVRGVAFVLGGFLLGLYNLPEGLAIALGLPVAHLLLTRLSPGRAHRYWTLAGVAAALGCVVSYLAPGRAAREAKDAGLRHPDGLGDLVSGTLAGARDIADLTVLSAGIVVALVCGVAIGWLARRGGRAGSALVDSRYAALAAVILAILGVLLCLSVAAGQVFSYEASYHTLAPQTAFTLGALSAGVAVAALPGRVPRFVALVGAAVAAVLVAPATLTATTGFVDLVLDRLSVWEAGPAPVGYISDIDVDVIRECAAGIDLVRP